MHVNMDCSGDTLLVQNSVDGIHALAILIVFAFSARTHMCSVIDSFITHCLSLSRGVFCLPFLHIITLWMWRLSLSLSGELCVKTAGRGQSAVHGDTGRVPGRWPGGRCRGDPLHVVRLSLGIVGYDDPVLIRDDDQSGKSYFMTAPFTPAN